MYIILIIIAIISGMVSGMGIGGGSIFILLVTIFEILGQKEAQAYNLLMFISIGILITITGIKDKNIDKSLLKKLIFPILFGSIIGSYLLNNINEEKLKIGFYIFILLMGIYEIVASLKNIINEYKSKRVKNIGA